MTAYYDALVIGGGHNGLVCAFYLARAGMRVRVLERRHVVGGAAVTEEFAPGFRNSTASYTVSLLQPKVIRDMRLHDRGLRIVAREAANFVPFDDDYLLLGEGRSRAEIARLSPADAAALPAYEAALERIADVLRDMALRAPPGIGAKSWLAALAGGRGAARLPLDAKRDLVALFAKSAREFLDGWFVDDRVKAAFAFDAVVGNYAAPSTPGSAYVLLHHVFGEVNGRKGAWGHAIGGMGAITQAMAAACRDIGVEISLEAPVARVLVDCAKVAGVVLESGEEIAAKVVAANVGPALLYRRMIARHELPGDFARRIDGYACGSGTLRMNVALSELPSFAVLPGRERAAHHTAGIVLAPGMDYMERAFDDAKAHGWSRAPIVELLIPSTLDDTLAPAGAHVASLFCQQFAPVLPEGRSWAAERESAADAAIAVVERFAPGFARSIMARQVHTPADLEDKFGLVGGDIFHGRMSLDQLWAARPVLGHGDYRGALRGLYHCGAGAHPGGGVTGAPGHNAARAILGDRGWVGRFRH